MRESFESLDSNIFVDVFHRKGDRPSVVAQSFTVVTQPAFQRDRVILWLADHRPESRLQHVRRGEEAAIAIVQPYRFNQDKAEQVGLMQNLLRLFNPSRLLKMVQDEGLEILYEFL